MVAETPTVRTAACARGRYRYCRDPDAPRAESREVYRSPPQGRARFLATYRRDPWLFAACGIEEALYTPRGDGCRESRINPVTSIGCAEPARCRVRQASQSFSPAGLQAPVGRGFHPACSSGISALGVHFGGRGAHRMCWTRGEERRQRGRSWPSQRRERRRCRQGGQRRPRAARRPGRLLGEHHGRVADARGQVLPSRRHVDLRRTGGRLDPQPTRDPRCRHVRAPTRRR